MSIQSDQINLEQGTAFKTDERLTLHPYRNQRISFALAIALQLVMLCAVAAPRAYTLATGTTITLRTVPVDPWDIFRGSYVRLNYEISSLESKGRFTSGQTVYVVLKKQGKYWQAVDVLTTKTQDSDSPAIKGKVNWDYNGKVSINYGIERFYVPEGRGRYLEKQKHLKVDVVVDRDGNAVVRNVIPEM